MTQTPLPDPEELPLKMRTYPTVQHAYQQQTQETQASGSSGPLYVTWLRQLCIEAGADDVGFVSLARPELDDQRADIFAHAPFARTLISFVCKMNREPIRSPARFVANTEFHEVNDQVKTVSHTIAARLQEQGIRAMKVSELRDKHDIVAQPDESALS